MRVGRGTPKSMIEKLNSGETGPTKTHKGLGPVESKT